MVVATTSDKTGAEAAKAFKGRNVIAVTHCYGFAAHGKFELKEEYKRFWLMVLKFIQHALSSAERAIYKRFGTLESLELISNTLRLMGEGTKACVEITFMATECWVNLH
ncbi:MAG: hypothetical protein N3E52_03330 [Candidatus Bathyarchaeota archaeon]|nr:hypothetical protein [Candidatus Bathyarchaeota archaeon]